MSVFEKLMVSVTASPRTVCVTGLSLLLSVISFPAAAWKSAFKKKIVTEPVGELETLAAQVSRNATILSTYLHNEQLPPPSFNQKGPTTVLPRSAPDDVKVARQALIEASLQTFQLALGPSEYISNLAVSVCL